MRRAFSAVSKPTDFRNQLVGMMDSHTRWKTHDQIYQLHPCEPHPFAKNHQLLSEFCLM